MKIRYPLIMLVCMFSSTLISADTHSIIGSWALEVSSPRGVQHPMLMVTSDEDTDGENQTPLQWSNRR
jgi:hypothetical protein